MCVLSVIELRWPKKKNFYDFASIDRTLRNDDLVKEKIVNQLSHETKKARLVKRVDVLNIIIKIIIVTRTNSIKFGIDKTSDRFLSRLCGVNTEIIRHITSGCSKMAQREHRN